MDTIYYGSSVQDLTIIAPSYTPHFKKDAVIASEDRDVAALSLGKFLGDYSCYPVPSNGHVIWQEHFKGAFNLRYGSENGQRSGSLYTLDKGLFFHLPTMWNKEVVSFKSAVPVYEHKIDDVYMYINEMLDYGFLELRIAEKHFEELPNCKQIVMDMMIRDVYREDMKRYNPSTFRKWIGMID